jgi:5-oxoprolinase (ATP-hydrolysing) subunit A
MPPATIQQVVAEQLATFCEWAAAAGVPVRHVKPHGALYNVAAKDIATARAIVAAILGQSPGLRLYAPAGSELEKAGVAAGLPVDAEFFADRNYRADGSLVPRAHPQAVIEDPAEAATRVLQVLRRGAVRSLDGPEVPMRFSTICLHGDSPSAVQAARLLRQRLEAEGVRIAAAARVCRWGGAARRVRPRR